MMVTFQEPSNAAPAFAPPAKTIAAARTKPARSQRTTVVETAFRGTATALALLAIRQILAISWGISCCFGYKQNVATCQCREFAVGFACKASKAILTQNRR